VAAGRAEKNRYDLQHCDRCSPHEWRRLHERHGCGVACDTAARVASAIRLMRAVILFILSLAFLSCRKNASVHADPVRPRQSMKTNAAPAVAASGMKIEGDKLLMSGEIESVVGEPAKQAVTSARTEAGFAISQCYFQTATPAKSVVVTVTSRGPGPDAKEPRQFWAEKFHGEGNDEKDNEEPQRRQAPPEKVEGVGDEAYWVESGSTGALYALQADRFIRVAIGGSDDKAVKIGKAKKLAELVLKRL
jgi:hypothetical protein